MVSFSWPHHSEPNLTLDRQLSPEEALARAVIAQCWRDAFGAFESDKYYESVDHEFDRASARRWLIEDFGDDAADRSLFCDLAGVCPEFLKARAIKRLADLRATEVERFMPERCGIAQCERDSLYERLDRSNARRELALTGKGRLANARLSDERGWWEAVWGRATSNVCRCKRVSCAL